MIKFFLTPGSIPLQRDHMSEKILKNILDRDVRDQFLHIETETQCTQTQFLTLRLRLLNLVSNIETETLWIGKNIWDWYLDFCLWYQKLRLRLRPSSVSNIETHTETFNLKKKQAGTELCQPQLKLVSSLFCFRLAHPTELELDWAGLSLAIKEYLDYREGSHYGENREWKCKKFRENR